jgi:hypothetical protein
MGFEICLPETVEVVYCTTLPHHWWKVRMILKCELYIYKYVDRMYSNITAHSACISCLFFHEEIRKLIQIMFSVYDLLGVNVLLVGWHSSDIADRMLSGKLGSVFICFIYLSTYRHNEFWVHLGSRISRPTAYSTRRMGEGPKAWSTWRCVKAICINNLNVTIRIMHEMFWRFVFEVSNF